MNLDVTFLVGVGVVISAIIVFCGSVWLLLTVVLGARLAYFVTACVTLAFLFIMGLVWSFGTPLGPVGEFGKPVTESIPHWNPIDVGDDPNALDFGPAADYPDAPWEPVDQDDPAQTAQAAELEGDAADAIQEAIDQGDVTAFEDSGAVTPVEDSTRLLETEDATYGLLQFQLSEAAANEEAAADGEIAPGEVESLIEDAGTVAVAMQFAPGNPLGKARYITAGTFLLLLLHLVGLSFSERNVRREREAAQTNNGNGAR